MPQPTLARASSDWVTRAVQPVKTINFYCPHMDCERDYVAPQLSVEQRRILADLFRQAEQVRNSVRPLRREDRKVWSHQIHSLNNELLQRFREFAGEGDFSGCLGHMTRVKDVCFMCGSPIVGEEIVYCDCGTPNLNW